MTCNPQYPTELIQAILFTTHANNIQLGFSSNILRVVDSEDRLQYQYRLPLLSNPKKLVLYQTVKTLCQHAITAELYAKDMFVYRVHPAKTWGDGTSIVQDPPAEVLRDFAQFHSTPTDTVLQNRVQAAMQAVALTEEERQIVEHGFLSITVDGAANAEAVNMNMEGAPRSRYDRERRVCVYGEECVDLYKIVHPAVYFYALSKVSQRA